jgi:U3 small nucleolar RNA-associated protein 5
MLMGPLVPGKPGNAIAQIPSGVSLSTVLTQALRSNDSEMLESCFHVGDLDIVRATIQRLDSVLAASLLQKLSERLAARPGRYGHLLIWVQWTCIAHGGAIAGNAAVAKRMSSLFKIMDQRSSTLPSLLLLKGKLDMLDAQLNLRQSSATTRRSDGIDSEDDEELIYVEGQEDENDPSDLEEDEKASTRRIKPSRDANGMLIEEEEVLPNGLTAGSDFDVEDEDDDEVDGEGDEGEEDEADMLDIEAEESFDDDDSEGEESLDEDEEDSDKGESAGSMADFIGDSEDDEEELSDAAKPVPKGLPPSKKLKTSLSKSKAGKASGKRR